MLILFIFLGVVFLLYKYLTRNNDYWKKRNVAYEEPLLLFGNAKDFFFLKKRFQDIVRHAYEAFPNEKFVGIFIGWRPEIVLRDPELIKQILVKDFGYFHDRLQEVDFKKEPLNAHLINLTGEKWKLIRQKLTPAFSSGKTKAMFPLLLEKGDCLEHRVRDSIRMGESLEIRETMARFTTDVIASCAFGIQTNSLYDDQDPFRVMGRRIFAPTLFLTYKRILRFISPRVFYLLGHTSTDKESEDYFSGSFYKILEERRNNKIIRKDFIDLLLNISNTKVNMDDKNDFVFADEVLLAQAFVFFLAGFETSSTTLSFAFHELALNKEIQEKLRNEISRVVQKHDGNLTYEGILDMHYLDMVLDETFRKHSVLGIIQRVCCKRYVIPETNVVLEKGIKVRIPVHGLHLDPKYFPEPKKFDPERFSPENKGGRHSSTFLPFGEGPRACIAERFGRLQTKLALLKIVQNFHLELDEKSETELVHDPKAMLTASASGIYLKFTPVV